MRGLFKLTWLETKIFAREPLGLIGSTLIPVALFVLMGRMVRGRVPTASTAGIRALAVDVPVLAAILIMLNTVLSLVTIIAIYREGGILKRLRATPLRPQTILTAHVLVKLLMSAATLALLAAAGKRFYPVDVHVPIVGFTVALLISTLSVLSIGFVIASLVPTARFAQPVGSLILFPMIGLCGLFLPIAALPSGLQVVARGLPLTYAASLLKGVLVGDAWSAHVTDVAALIVTFVLFTALSAKVFRWE
jgi:ABC-2 type transport system permease protein